MDAIVSNLTVSFNNRSVLKNLSLTFRENTTTCIVGPSGCGKTTLLNAMLGLIKPDCGTIAGVDLKRTAVVFQEDRLIDHLTPLDNIRLVLPHGCRSREVLQALDAIGLGESISRPVSTLSGGMKRRVALLRALLTDADLLLLDEPFKGLDTATRELVIRFMRPLILNRTIVLVTHAPEEAELLSGSIIDLGSMTAASK